MVNLEMDMLQHQKALAHFTPVCPESTVGTNSSQTAEDWKYWASEKPVM